MVLYIRLYWPLLAGTAAIACWKGGKIERQAALLYVVASLAEMLVRSPPAQFFVHLEYGVAVVDVGLLIGLVGVSVRSGYVWLYLASALQTLGVLAHLIKWLMPTITPMAYIIMTGAGGYPQVLLLLIGTITCMVANQRRRSSPERCSDSVEAERGARDRIAQPPVDRGRHAHREPR